MLLLVRKGVAYGVSLSCFRGGPVFPALFLGAAGGIAVSHLPGLPMIAAVGMGIGAMSVSMLNPPLTSVLLASVFLEADAVSLIPLIIVSVVVAYVVSARLLVPTEEPRPERPPHRVPDRRPRPNEVASRHPYAAVEHGHLRILTARAITRPMMASEIIAWRLIASLVQRASGITSVGLKARLLLKPRWR